MSQYLGVDPTGRIREGRGRIDIYQGPPTDCPAPEESEYGLLTFHLWNERIVFTGPKPYDQLYWIDGAPGWVDARILTIAITEAYSKCFTDINAIVWDAVGNMTEEYKDAEVEARTFKAGGYLGTAPEMVACYAAKESQTATWATDDIIARADAFNAAKKAMRTQRMARQKEMQEATTLAQLDAVVAAWDGFITQLRTQLGL